MPDPFWRRGREVRLLPALVVYLGASWLVLQVTSLLQDQLDLPEWLTPVAIVLLAVGLVIITATAWIQSRPLTGTRAGRDEIPGAWEIDLKDMTESVARGRLPHLTWSRAILGGVVAFALLFGLAGVYVLVQARGEKSQPDATEEVGAAPGVAVLPFDVRGSGLDVWREGMVDLLSTNLDGVGGLRTIDSRTMLARWRETTRGDKEVLDQQLQAAAAAGASYALVGSVVASGAALRLSADVYNLSERNKLGHAQVEGTPDSIFGLVDRLSVDIVRTILGKDMLDLPPLNVAALTTTSLVALKAFLEGEVLLRRSDFPAAMRRFEEAVRADSLFALAWQRLGTVSGWTETDVGVSGPKALIRAVRMADRLPEREALLARAELAYWRRSVDGIAPLQIAVKNYPEDAEAWYLLGENLLHVGEEALVPPHESDRAFAKAVELDPDFAPAYYHLMSNAVSVHGDSIRAAKFISDYQRLAPTGEYLQQARLAFVLAFGDSSARAEAVASLDSVSDANLTSVVIFYLWCPRFLSPMRDVAQTLVERRNFDGNWFAYYADAERGRLRAAISLATEEGAPSWLAGSLYESLVHDLPVPTDLVDARISAGAGDSTFIEREFYVGARAADTQRWDEHAVAVSKLRRQSSDFLARADSTRARSLEALAEALDGYGAWRQGRLAEGFRLLDRARPRIKTWVEEPTSDIVRWWLGELSVQRGNWKDAERYFASLWPFTHAHYRRAQALEQLGRHEEAREEYELFADTWKDADPELQPLVADARQAAKRLTSVIAE